MFTFSRGLSSNFVRSPVNNNLGFSLPVPGLHKVRFKGSGNGVLLSHNIYHPIHADDGPPFLIAHGLLGSKQNWNTIAKAAARNLNRKVITFDARNHGDSPHTDEISYDLMADDILHLAHNLGITKFTLMGHSMGGRTCMTLALKYPEYVERLVVVDMSPLELNADFPTMKVYVQALREFQKKLDGMEKPLSDMRKMADTALRAVVIDPVVRAFLLTNLATKDGKVYWKPNLKVLLDQFDEIGKFPSELLKHKFEEPTLFIRGQKSLYIPVGDFPRIKKIFTQALLTTVENAGHWPHAENVLGFMDVMLPFVNGDIR